MLKKLADKLWKGERSLASIVGLCSLGYINKLRKMWVSCFVYIANCTGAIYLSHFHWECVVDRTQTGI